MRFSGRADVEAGNGAANHCHRITLDVIPDKPRSGADPGSMPSASR